MGMAEVGIIEADTDGCGDGRGRGGLLLLSLGHRYEAAQVARLLNKVGVEVLPLSFRISVAV